MNATIEIPAGAEFVNTGSEVLARFLKEGDIIERGGVLMMVIGKAIPDPANRLERVQIVVEALEGDDRQWRPCSLHRELWIRLYDMIVPE